jgi:hypothetical protein
LDPSAEADEEAALVMEVDLFRCEGGKTSEGPRIPAEREEEDLDGEEDIEAIFDNLVRGPSNLINEVRDSIGSLQPSWMKEAMEGTTRRIESVLEKETSEEASAWGVSYSPMAGLSADALPSWMAQAMGRAPSPPAKLVPSPRSPSLSPGGTALRPTCARSPVGPLRGDLEANERDLGLQWDDLEDDEREHGLDWNSSHSDGGISL